MGEMSQQPAHSGSRVLGHSPCRGTALRIQYPSLDRRDPSHTKALLGLAETTGVTLAELDYLIVGWWSK